MPLYLGSDAPDDCRVGSDAVTAIYLGTQRVWPPLLVQLTGGTFVSGGGDLSLRTVAYSVRSDGWEAATQDGVSATTTQWLMAGAAADYEVRFTQNSRTGGGGATASTGWLSCASTQTIQVVSSIIPGYLTANYTVELRLAATGEVLATATVRLESNY